jgi:hypothetical protein
MIIPLLAITTTKICPVLSLLKANKGQRRCNFWEGRKDAFKKKLLWQK